MVPEYEGFVRQLEGTDEWHELNRQRKIAHWRRVLGWFVGLGLLILGFSLLIFGTDGDTITSGLGALVMSVVMVIIFYRLSHKHYSVYYKQMVVPPLVQQVLNQSKVEPDGAAADNECTFDHEDCIDFDKLLEIPLFHKYNHEKVSYTGEDLFSGWLGNTEFQFSDFVIKRNRDLVVVDQDVDVTVFRGLVFIADFHKAFEGTVTLMTRRGKKYKHQTMVGSPMKTISYEFDKMFKVTTTDEITARYLLPVNMLERLVALRKLFPQKGMAICLHDGLMAISIHDVDFFEIKGLSKLKSKGVKRTYDEIKAIIDIVDILNLNLRIWGKQGRVPENRNKGTKKRKRRKKASS